VAFSHAIVSEKLNYIAPGLQAAKHYLEFSTVNECVEQAGKLMDDRLLRENLMRQNEQYFQEYLRPDKLVWRAMKIALEKAG